MATSDVTQLLDRARSGDADAFRSLITEVYSELHVIARSQRRKLGASDTMNTTAVVHEAYARLGGAPQGNGMQAFKDRAHFFRLTSSIMRSIIVDFARAQSAAKRGGRGRALSLEDLESDGGEFAMAFDPSETLSLDEALADLERLDEESARIVEMRYFVGLTNDEVANALGLSPATVKRRWTVARAWLVSRLSEDAG